MRNPSKTHITEDSQQVLKKYHEKAQNAILCDFKIIDNLYKKLESSFDKIKEELKKKAKIEEQKRKEKEIKRQNELMKKMKEQQKKEVLKIKI